VFEKKIEEFKDIIERIKKYGGIFKSIAIARL